MCVLQALLDDFIALFAGFLSLSLCTNALVRWPEHNGCICAPRTAAGCCTVCVGASPTLRHRCKMAKSLTMHDDAKKLGRNSLRVTVRTGIQCYNTCTITFRIELSLVVNCKSRMQIFFVQATASGRHPNPLAKQTHSNEKIQLATTCNGKPVLRARTTALVT